MTPLPRGTCPECSRDVALRNHGELREHRNEGGKPCWTSGLTISEAERDIEISIREVEAGVRREPHYAR